MTSPFTAVLSGRDRTWVLAENEHFVAILETKPLVLGHVVVISKKEEDHLFDLGIDALASLMVFSKPIAEAIRETVPCKKVGVAVIGLETRHAHLHLVPIQSADDLNFARAKLTVEEPALRKTLEALRILCG